MQYFNAEQRTVVNVVQGLLGIILTMTMVLVGFVQIAIILGAGNLIFDVTARGRPDYLAMAAMPRPAQVIAEAMPATHFMRMARAIILRDADNFSLQSLAARPLRQTMSQIHPCPAWHFRGRW